MKTITNFLFYNTLFALIFSLVELFLYPPLESFKVSSFPLFIFIFANYFLISLIYTLIFSTLSFLLFRSSQAVLLKFKINALFYTYELRTIFMIKTFALMGYLLMICGLMIVTIMIKLKDASSPPEWRFFYLFIYSAAIITFSLLGFKLNNYLDHKLKDAQWLSYKLYLTLNTTFIISVITVLSITLYSGYTLKIFYIVQALFLLLFNLIILFWFVISDHNKHFFHKLTIITFATLFFINGFSIFEKKEINLKKTLFILNQAHFLSEKINSTILKTYFDQDHDGFYSFFGAGDCNDHAPNINPLSEDIPDNNIDEDCNGFDAKSILSDPLNRGDYHRFRLEYPPKTLILIAENYPYTQKKKLISHFKKNPHTLLLSKIILPTPDPLRNNHLLLHPDPKIDLSSSIKQVKKIPRKPLPYTIYLHKVDQKKIFSLFYHLIKLGHFTQIYLLPLSLNGSGALGYKGENHALYMDQIESFIVVWSQNHTYRKQITDPISLKSFSLLINNLIPGQNQHTVSLTDPIFFNGSLKNREKLILSKRYNQFGDLLEQSILSGKKQCIYQHHNISCFNLKIPPEIAGITNQEKQRFLFHLKKDRKE